MDKLLTAELSFNDDTMIVGCEVKNANASISRTQSRATKYAKDNAPSWAKRILIIDLPSGVDMFEKVGTRLFYRYAYRFER